MTDYHNNARHCCTGVVADSTVALVDSMQEAAGNNSLPAAAENNCSLVALDTHPSHDGAHDRSDGVSNRDACGDDPSRAHACPRHRRGQPQRKKTRRKRLIFGSNKLFSSCHNPSTVIVNAIKGIPAQGAWGGPLKLSFLYPWRPYYGVDMNAHLTINRIQ